MVGATDEAVVAGLFEIGVKAVVEVIGAFCSFDEHEAQALAVDFGCGKCVPIDLALMMAYVDSAYGIALGVSGVAKDALPDYGVGTDEEGIKGYGAEGEKQYGSRPHGVGGYSVGDLHNPQRFQEARNASFFLVPVLAFLLAMFVWLLPWQPEMFVWLVVCRHQKWWRHGLGCACACKWHFLRAGSSLAVRAPVCI